MKFELHPYDDDTWQLIHEDWLHGDDIAIVINPDGTFTHRYYDPEQEEVEAPDDLREIEKPIPDLYKLLVDLHQTRAERDRKYHEGR